MYKKIINVQGLSKKSKKSMRHKTKLIGSVQVFMLNYCLGINTDNKIKNPLIKKGDLNC
jgi:hypothetical protein